MRNIYLDYNATTPVDPEVVEAMLPFFGQKFGNASSAHSFGREAKVALENARELAADLLGCEPSEIVFTGGGTEGDNLCLKGGARSQLARRNGVVISTIEHSAIRDSARALPPEGCICQEVGVSREGFVDATALRGLVTETTSLVSIMHANNEIGTVQDIASLATIVHERGALFHTDAVQSFGKIPVNVAALGVDFLTLSAHKIYGPKGVGLVYVKSGSRLAPMTHGGSQEKGRRTGTENVALIVGLATAMKIAVAKLDSEFRRMSELSERFLSKVRSTIPEVTLNGPELVAGRVTRTPSSVNLSFSGVEGEPLLLSLDLEGIAVSSGSACHAGAVDPSHVLLGIGCSPDAARSSVRFSLGRYTTVEEIDHVCAVLPPIIERLRQMSPNYARAAR